MKNCLNCTHSKFDEQWGEHKCLIFQHRLYDAATRGSECSFHKPVNLKSTNGEVNE